MRSYDRKVRESAYKGHGTPMVHQSRAPRKKVPSTRRITLTVVDPMRWLASSAKIAVQVQIIATVSERISPMCDIN